MEGRIAYKHIGGMDWETIAAKLDNASRGLGSKEGKSRDYRSILVQ